jgi:hypothetical protein
MPSECINTAKKQLIADPIQLFSNNSKMSPGDAHLKPLNTICWHNEAFPFIF